MLDWRDDRTFVIGDIQYVCCPLLHGGFRSEPGRFCLVKPRSAVEAYARLLQETAPRSIVEVGLHEGASTAFFAEMARPEKLVAIDLAEDLRPALDDFVTRRGFRDRVSIHGGVDQGDTQRLKAIVDAEIGTRGVDLVVDDASHRTELTRRTFDCLFPLLRPGGKYLIEDWWWAHTRASEDIWPTEVPLSVMLFEVVLACAYEPTIIVDVCASRNWALVTRGEAQLDPDSFNLSQCYGARGRALVTSL